MSQANVFTPAIKTIVTRGCVVSAAIAIIPGVGVATNAFNQTVMIQQINTKLGISLTKGKVWSVVKRAGMALLATKALSFGASFIPFAGSAVSVTLEAASTYAVAYVYVDMMKSFAAKGTPAEQMTDEAFEKAVDAYMDEHEDMIKEAVESGKSFYKKNKDTVSDDEVERMKALVLAGAKEEEAASSAEQKARHCTNCGAVLPAGAKFCMECGTKCE